jgi:hypothetical protein
MATRLFTRCCSKIAPERLGEPAEAVQAGHRSVKMFTTDITPSRRGRMVGFGDIGEVLRVLAQAGGIAAIHAEDGGDRNPNCGVRTTPLARCARVRKHSPYDLPLEIPIIS